MTFTQRRAFADSAAGSPEPCATAAQLTASNVFTAAQTINSTGGTYGALVVNANTGTPPTIPHIGAIHIVGADNDFGALYIDSFGVGVIRSIINLRNARGTLAAPLQNLADNELGRISGRGHDGTDFTSSLSSISFMAAENITPAAQGSYVTIRTTAIGSVGGGSLSVPPETVRFQPSGGVSIGDVTYNATDPGHGMLSVATGIGVGVAVPLAALDVLGNIQLGDSRTDSDNKNGNVLVPHYLSDTEESMSVVIGFAGAAANTIFVGGGSSSYNAATAIRFFTAADNATVTGTQRMIIDSAGNVGIGAGTPTSQLHVDQASATGALPVLLLDQADVSEEMIEFVSVAGVGNAIEAVALKTLTTTHFIKVTINGDTRYIPAGTIA